MSQNFDDDYKMAQVLISYRSDDEDDKSKQEKVSKQNTKQQQYKFNINDSIGFDIKDSIDFTQMNSKQQDKKRYPTFHQNIYSSGISQNSDWNQDTSNFQSQSNRNSLWDDSSEFHVQTNFSKIKKADNDKIQQVQQKKEQEEKKNLKQKKQQQHIDNDDMVLIGKSMYTSKPMSTIKGQKIPINASIQKSINPNQIQQSENQNVMLGIEESVYLTSQPVSKKSKGIKFEKLDNHCFWKYKQKTIEISYNLIESLREQFQKQQTLIPLIQQDQYKSEYSELLIGRLTQLLNLFLQKQFINVFPKLKQSIKKNLKQQTTYMQYIKDLPFLKKHNYSKVQIMKGFMIQKISSLKLIKMHYESRSDEDGKYVIKQIIDEINICQKNIGDLQLLISFEKAQKYCQTKLANNIQQKVWKVHHQKLKQMRKKWIDYQKMIFDA